MQATPDVHDAPCVRNHQRWCFRFLQVSDLTLEHFRREFGVGHREYAAKPAAIFGFRQFDDTRVLHMGKQLSRLTIDTQPA